ncbi:hypothetical protein BGW38_002370 [Lunasporangiospora selenospora]|uniref:C2H2-type domain-containing protein n=1 Tax=Lunasporangiospora selenospora TaxID=979761 RepID=A0A9P6FSP1_9FUNG|nr:hypothetical protein BGW38_002370 [Lunasporangiospora selenospora]
MTFFDPREQALAAMPSTVVPTNPTNPPLPLYARSLSAPSTHSLSQLGSDAYASTPLHRTNSSQGFAFNHQLNSQQQFAISSQSSLVSHPFQASLQHPLQPSHPVQHSQVQQPFQPQQQAQAQQPFLQQLGQHHTQQQHLFQLSDLQATPSLISSGNYTFRQQQSIHPFQVDAVPSGLGPSNSEVAIGAPISIAKLEFQPDPFTAAVTVATRGFVGQDMDDIQVSGGGSVSCSPTSSSLDSNSSPVVSPFQSSPTNAVVGESGSSASAFRSNNGRLYSLPYDDLDFSQLQLDLPDEFIGYSFPRHGSVGSLYPMTQSHELLEPTSTSPWFEAPGTAMVPSSSSTSISSNSSMPSASTTASTAVIPSSIPITAKVSSLHRKASHGLLNGLGKTTAGGVTANDPKPRRASLSPETSSGRVFPCIFDDCGKLFKRSEHLKRHVRSVHTLEKPFTCPFPNCPKRFSRSDNLNQHIRIHRHDKERPTNSPSLPSTPGLASALVTASQPSSTSPTTNVLAPANSNMGTSQPIVNYMNIHGPINPQTMMMTTTPVTVSHNLQIQVQV